jgi:hypothetical protein
MTHYVRDRVTGRTTFTELAANDSIFTLFLLGWRTNTAGFRPIQNQSRCVLPPISSQHSLSVVPLRKDLCLGLRTSDYREKALRPRKIQ